MDKKKVYAALYGCTSKVNLRPILQGVHHSGQTLVACDGFVLAVVSLPEGEGFTYELGGKTILKDGTEMKDYNYPNYRAVLNGNKGMPLEEENAKLIFSAAKALAKAKAPDPYNKRTKREDVKLAFTVADEYIALSVPNLLRLAKVFEAVGETPVIEATAWHSAVILKSNSVEALIMPCLTTDELTGKARAYGADDIDGITVFSIAQAGSYKKEKETETKKAWYE